MPVHRLARERKRRRKRESVCVCVCSPVFECVHIRAGATKSSPPVFLNTFIRNETMAAAKQAPSEQPSTDTYMKSRPCMNMTEVLFII